MLASFVLLGRLLGSLEFGRFALVHGLLISATVFALWGVPQAVVRFVAVGEHGSGRVMDAARQTLIRVNLISSVVLLAGSPLIARWLLGDGSLTAAVCAGLGFILAQVVIQTAVAFEQGRMQFLRAAVINGVSGMSFLAGSCAGAVLGGVLGAVIGLGLSSGCLALYLLWTNEALLHGDRATPETLRRVARFSSLTVVSAGLVWPVLFLGQAILQEASGYEQVALFAAARPWFQGIILIPTIVARTSLPLASREYAGGDRRALFALIGGGAVAGVLTVLPVAAGLWFWPHLVAGLYGSGFEGAVDVLQILAATALLIGLHLSFGQVPAVMDRMEIGIIINLVWAGTFLSLAWILSPTGASGLALALLVAYGVNAAITIAASSYLMRRLPHGA